MNTENSTVKNSIINGTQERAKLKSPVNENSSVKNSVNGTHSAMLFSQKGEKAGNISVKSRVTGTEGRMLFSKHCGKFENTCVTNRVQCIFQEKEKPK